MTDTLALTAPSSLKGLWNRIFNRPQHRLYETIADTREACIQQLEAAAYLPEHDLFVQSELHNMCTFPMRAEGTKYFLGSKRGQEWSKDPHKRRAISGYVFEIDNFHMLSQAKIERLGYSYPLLAIRNSSPKMYIGKLFVIKNCSGIFRDGVCIECEHHSDD